MARYSVRYTDYLPWVEALHSLTFPDTELDLGPANWLVWHEDNPDDPVGFCSVRPLTHETDTVFLCRAGLLHSARGSGLQRRMIKVRERWARANGYTTAITYVVTDNGASLSNLIKCGYRLYTPAYRYAGDVLYLQKAL